MQTLHIFLRHQSALLFCGVLIFFARVRLRPLVCIRVPARGSRLRGLARHESASKVAWWLFRRCYISARHACYAVADLSPCGHAILVNAVASRGPEKRYGPPARCTWFYVGGPRGRLQFRRWRVGGGQNYHAQDHAGLNSGHGRDPLAPANVTGTRVLP